jgi:hypothetical protein
MSLVVVLRMNTYPYLLEPESAGKQAVMVVGPLIQEMYKTA